MRIQVPSPGIRTARLGFDPAEPLLIPQRASTIYPLQPNGQDIELVCTTREGGTFYCKTDKPGRPIRATEMLATRLAGHVAIPTPYCSVIETESGDLLFGSLSQPNRLAATLTEIGDKVAKALKKEAVTK